MSAPTPVLDSENVQTGASQTTCDVSLLMPCLNERQTLPYCIEEAKEAQQMLEAAGYTSEILIADNGSDDGSQAFARSQGARVVAVPEKGYGNALIGGAYAARGRFIVMADADCSYDFRECLPLVEDLAHGKDLSMGTRLKGDIHPGAMPWKNRYIGNPVLSGILNLLFRSGLSDAHCGLRALTKEAFHHMDLSAPGMEFASEMVIKAACLDLPRAEHPVSLRPDKRDRPPHLRPWQDGWRHLRYMLLFSPFWLFIVPGLGMAGFGLLISSLLLSTPTNEPFLWGSIYLNDHWMVMSSAMVTLGFLTICFGLVGHVVNVTQQLLRPSRVLSALHRWVSFENALLAGGLGFLSGLGIAGWVVYIWASNDFGPLYQIRTLVAASTVMICSVQVVFGGFLLSILKEAITHRQRKEHYLRRFQKHNTI